MLTNYFSSSGRLVVNSASALIDMPSICDISIVPTTNLWKRRYTSCTIVRCKADTIVICQKVIRCPLPYGSAVRIVAQQKSSQSQVRPIAVDTKLRLSQHSSETRRQKSGRRGIKLVTKCDGIYADSALIAKPNCNSTTFFWTWSWVRW